MTMSPQGFRLLARMEAPANDRFNSNQEDFYRRNGLGQITHVKNQDQNDNGITAGYGIYTRTRDFHLLSATDQAYWVRRQEYMRDTHSIPTTTADAIDHWTPAGTVLRLLNYLAGTVPTFSNSRS